MKPFRNRDLVTIANWQSDHGKVALRKFSKAPRNARSRKSVEKDSVTVSPRLRIVIGRSWTERRNWRR